MFTINVGSEGPVMVVELTGEIDGSTAPKAQAGILEAVPKGGALLLDASGLTYMSSAGLRMLLSVYRTLTGNNARIVLVGLNEEIRDTMSATGFLDFFTTCETRDQGLATLG